MVVCCSMICWSFLLFHVYSNSVRTPDYYSWSRMKHLGATVFKWESQDMVGQMDKWLNMPAKRIYCKKYVLQGNFFTSLYTKYKARKTKWIFSQMPQRLIGDESTSAGDCQYSLIFPLLPYNTWLLVYLVKGELLISTLL